MSKEISIVFHNGFNCGYYFIIKKLTKEVKEKVSVPIEKEVTKIDKNWEEIRKNISYRLKFIDSANFMVSQLSSPSSRWRNL